MEIKDIEQKFDFLIMIGDLHNDFHKISYHLNSNELKKVCYIQVGDFTIGIQPSKEAKVLKQVNGFLKQTNSHCFVVRGNHDNPMYFNSENMFFSNIHFVKDYSILKLNINEKNISIFCLGGAISIDRKLKEFQGLWSQDEVVKFDFEKIKTVKNIDFIVTHTAPHLFPPYGVSHLIMRYVRGDKSSIIPALHEGDVNLLSDLTNERANFNLAYYNIIENNKETLKGWFYGHFHQSHITNIDGLFVRCLAIYEFNEVKL